jgi:hypothetical protein
MSNNPWVQQSPSSNFSPVSPITPMQPTIMTQIAQPEPQRPTSSRASADIRRLDGTPYLSGEKPVKVAKDMHAGAVPPAYHGAPAVATPEKADGCSKPNCNRCGKRKTIVAEQTSPPSTRNLPHFSRPISQSSTVAGPSTQPIKKCHKCGKSKRPVIAPALPQPTFGAQHRFSSQSTIVPSQARPQQPQLSILAGDNLPRPSVPVLDIIPPSASTYRPRDSTVSTMNDAAPLIKGIQQPKPEYKPFRAGSLIRSLSKRSSKSKSGPPTPGSDNGDQSSGSGGFMGLIRKQSTRDYTKLGAEEPHSRPASPFSFMEAPNDDAFEMRPMTGKETEFNVDRNGSDGRRSSSIKSPVGGETLTVTRPEMYRSTSSAREGDLMLAIPEQGGDNRPQLTRFKSLRSGVSRAASTVSRSGSLKRLGSISKAWERNDMAIDAYQGEGGTISAY